MTTRATLMLACLAAAGSSCSIVQNLVQRSNAPKEFHISGAMLGTQPDLTPVSPDGGVLATFTAGQPIYGAVQLAGDPRTLGSDVRARLLWTASPSITTHAQLDALAVRGLETKELAPGSQYTVSLRPRAVEEAAAAGKQVLQFAFLAPDFDRTNRDQQLLVQALEEAAITKKRFVALLEVRNESGANMMYRSSYPVVLDFTGGGTYLDLNASLELPRAVLSEPEVEHAYLALLRQNPDWEYSTLRFTSEWVIRRNELGTILSRDGYVTYPAKDRRNGSCWIIRVPPRGAPGVGAGGVLVHPAPAARAR